jgi:riboflavin biosynthesis pyrimidine reductase
MMSSIDGRLFVDRWTAPAAGIKAAMFRGYYEEVASHFQSDGWIVGRKTMEEIIQGNPRTLLLEGGGRINGAFLKEGLIDEISLLVYPAIDGLAGVASIFEFIGRIDEQPAAGQSLRHISTETLEGGVVWLRYRVEKEVSA